MTYIGFSFIVRYMSYYRNYDVGRLSEIFKALSNSNRLSIFVKILDCCGPFSGDDAFYTKGECVGKLGEGLGIVPSTVSHHIKELRRAGLIQIERRGQKVECRIDPATLTCLIEFFSRQPGGRSK